MSVWVETVIAPPLEWKSGGTLEPFTPFEVKGTIRFGPRESGADLIWPETYEFEASPTPDGLSVVNVAEKREAEKNASLFGIPLEVRAGLVKFGTCMSLPTIRLRVMRSPQDSAGWPPGLERPPGPWSDETLSVLADQFLERGFNVGSCFLTTGPPDETWMPMIRGSHLRPITWRRRVIDTACIVASAKFEFGLALALQAVTAPVRQLELSFNRPTDSTDFVRGLIAGGGFTCLESLIFRVAHPSRPVPGVRPMTAQILREVAGFSAAFPLLRTFEIELERPSLPPIGVVG